MTLCKAQVLRKVQDGPKLPELRFTGLKKFNDTYSNEEVILGNMVTSLLVLKQIISLFYISPYMIVANKSGDTTIIKYK